MADEPVKPSAFAVLLKSAAKEKQRPPPKKKQRATGPNVSKARLCLRRSLSVTLILTPREGI